MIECILSNYKNRLLINKIITIKRMADLSTVDLSSMRKPYSGPEEVLREDSLESKNPFKLFHIWFDAVKKSGKVYEPNAVCLATCDKNGWPSARMVLLKGYGDQGFKIFTNYESRKGKEMVRIEGTVERVSEEESIEYFKNRPRASQLSARISQQSEVVENRDKLVEKYKEEELKFPNEVPKPHFWGGFKIIPTAFEFWVGQTDRLHDRIRFFKDNKVGEEAKVGDDGWLYQRLQP